MEFLTSNWQYALVVFMVAEKIVKLTPTKYDDILLDVIIKGLSRLVGIKK